MSDRKRVYYALTREQELEIARQEFVRVLTGIHLKAAYLATLDLDFYEIADQLEVTEQDCIRIFDEIEFMLEEEDSGLTEIEFHPDFEIPGGEDE